MRNHKSTKEEKIKWLINHSPLWEGLKLPDEYHRIITIAELMVQDGLYSKKSYYKDIRHSVINLITEARAEKRKRYFNERYSI